MSTVENFELGAILSIITGYNCTDDFAKVWKLVGFVCDDNTMGPSGLEMYIDVVKSHLLEIHPELKKVKFQKDIDIYEFIFQQEEKFGSILPITKLGEKLPKTELTDGSTYNQNKAEVSIKKLKSSK